MPTFDVKIYKSWAARNLAAAWVNTYVVSHDTDVQAAGWGAVIDGIVGAEKMISLKPVQFLHAVISTTRDEPTYQPESLKVIELIGDGSRVLAEGEIPLDLNICLKLKRNVAFGRSGTMFMRGCLSDNDVDANERGESVISVARSGLNNPVLLANFNGLFNNVPEGFDFVMKDKRMDDNQQTTPFTVRSVLSFSVAGVSINKRNHSYYDKKAKVANPAPA